jgi:hypothetical protein
MTRVTLLVMLTLTNHILLGQSRSFGVDLITRHDRHANYETNYAGRVYNDTYKLWGTSYGINLFYKKQLKQGYGFRVAVGYYRLGIDKMEGTLPFNIPGTSTARNINYKDGMTNLLYSTTQYHYNNLTLTFGLNKHFKLGRKTILELGTDLVGYYSISQKYKLFNGPNFYETKNKKPWEYGVNLNIGLIRTLGQYYIEPILLIPVYQNLKGDRVFYEDTEMNIDKWFHGVGLSLTIGRFF